MPATSTSNSFSRSVAPPNIPCTYFILLKKRRCLRFVYQNSHLTMLHQHIVVERWAGTDEVLTHRKVQLTQENYARSGADLPIAVSVECGRHERGWRARGACFPVRLVHRYIACLLSFHICYWIYRGLSRSPRTLKIFQASKICFRVGWITLLEEEVRRSGTPSFFLFFSEGGRGNRVNSNL